MANFVQLSPAYYAIQRMEGNPQVLIFQAGKLEDFAETLKSCLTDSLERVTDFTLPDADYKVGQVIFKVSLMKESGNIRTDIREWFTDPLTQQLRPTKKGVNLSLEQLTTVTAKIGDFVGNQRDSLNRLVAAISVESVGAQTDSAPAEAKTTLRKRKAVKPKLTASKKKAVKKQPKKAVQSRPTVESDQESIEIESSSEEEQDSE